MGIFVADQNQVVFKYESGTYAVVSGATGVGFVAQKLLSSGFNINSLRTQDVLRKDEWKKFKKQYGRSKRNS